MKKFSERFFYHFYSFLFGLGLRVYYKKITVAGADKVPTDLPIITTSNHPTGLMDVLIECQILAKCFRQKKKFDKTINSQSWRIVNTK